MTWRKYELWVREGRKSEPKLVSRHWTRKAAERKALWLTNYPEEFVYIMSLIPAEYMPVYTVKERL